MLRSYISILEKKHLLREYRWVYNWKILLGLLSSSLPFRSRLLLLRLFVSHIYRGLLWLLAGLLPTFGCEKPRLCQIWRLHLLSQIQFFVSALKHVLRGSYLPVTKFIFKCIMRNCWRFDEGVSIVMILYLCQQLYARPPRKNVLATTDFEKSWRLTYKGTVPLWMQRVRAI